MCSYVCMCVCVPREMSQELSLDSVFGSAQTSEKCVCVFVCVCVCYSKYSSCVRGEDSQNPSPKSFSHTTTRCNTLQQTAMHCNALQCTSQNPSPKSFCFVVLRRWHAGGTPVAGCILREDILSPNLQAQFCELYPADFCPLQWSNPSNLVIFKKWKSRIALLVHNAWRLYSNGLLRKKPARLALP